MSSARTPEQAAPSLGHEIVASYRLAHAHVGVHATDVSPHASTHHRHVSPLQIGPRFGSPT